MSAHTCPNGHETESSDYCDTCGVPVDQAPAADGGSSSGSRPPGASAGASAGGSGAGSAGSAGVPSPPTGSHPSAAQPCPNCTLVNTADALFCEGCGYDFTTGTIPRPATPTNPLDLGGAATGANDPDSTQPPIAPAVEVEWVAEVWVDPDWYADQESDEPCPSAGLPMVVPLQTQSLLIGRRSRSRNIHPEIECSPDAGVSRRQAQLTTDGQRWWVEDLQSSNGTYVGTASAPLPVDAIPPGQRRELAVDDRIYVGAWTRIVVRKATPEERGGQL